MSNTSKGQYAQEELYNAQEELYNAIKCNDKETIMDICLSHPDLIDCPYDFEEFGEQDDARDYYCELLPIYHAWAIAYDNELPNPLEIVHILLPFVDILKLNNQGQNILHVAAFTNEFDIFKYGITNKVDVYEKDNNDKTPLDYANEFNHTSICEYINKKNQ